MSDTKMLQILIDGQADIKNEIKEVKKEIENVNERLDKQGESLAYLEDDAPTIKDFNRLKNRVKVLENKLLN